MIDAIELSIVVSFWAMLFILPVGVLFGFILSKTHFKGKELIDAFLTLPMVLPPTVVGYILLVGLGKNGIIGGFFYRFFGRSIIFTWQAAALASFVVALPLMIKTSRAAFESVDRNFELVAKTLGKSDFIVFKTVSLPLATRGILAGSALSAARSLGEFGATLMVAGNIPGRTQTMTLAIYEAAMTGDDSTALKLVTVLSLLSLLLLFAINKLWSKGADHA